MCLTSSRDATVLGIYLFLLYGDGMTSPQESTEPITITGTGNMIIDMDDFFTAAFELADSNPDHPVEEEVQADG